MLRVTGTLLGVAALAVSVVLPATAVSSPTKGDVTVTTTIQDGDWWDTVHTTIRWCLPDTAAAGDELRIGLPEELDGFRPEFEVEGNDDSDLATALVEDDHVLLLTLTKDPADGTCSVAEMDSTLARGSDAAGRTIPLRYDVAGIEHVNRLKVNEWSGMSRTRANVWGEFVRSGDQCRVEGAGCIAWNFDTPAGPGAVTTITSTADDDQVFDCDTVQLSHVQLDRRGAVQAVEPIDGTVECSATELRAEIARIPDRAMARVSFLASVLEPDEVGGVTHRAAFSATIGDGGRTVIDEDSVRSNTAFGYEVPPTTAGEVPEQVDKSAGGGAGLWPYLALALAIGLATAVVFLFRRRT